MASVTIRLPLDRELEDAYETWRDDRRTLARLEELPDGARVVVYLGNRKFPTDIAAHAMHQHDGRLDICLEAGPDADIRAWLEAVRTGAVSI